MKIVSCGDHICIMKNNFIFNLIGLYESLLCFQGGYYGCTIKSILLLLYKNKEIKN